MLNNGGFGKTMENVERHKDIGFVTTEARRNYLMEKPNSHTIKTFFEYLLATMKKNKYL